jgi:hypothetical protein
LNSPIIYNLYQLFSLNLILSAAQCSTTVTHLSIMAENVKNTYDPIIVARVVLATAKSTLNNIRLNASTSYDVAQRVCEIANAENKTALEFQSTKHENKVAKSKSDLEHIMNDNEGKINAAIINVKAAQTSLELIIQTQIMGIESQLQQTAVIATMQVNATESNHKLALTELIQRQKTEIETLLSQQRQQITDIKTHSATNSDEIKSKLNNLKTELDALRV